MSYRADRLSASVYYASRCGCKLDANPTANTGTDDTAAVQAILDKASGGTPVHLIMDGLALVDTLWVWSNTTISGLSTGSAYGFFKMGYPNGGRSLLRNKHPVAGPTAPTDSAITLRQLYLDGNRRNGGYGVAPGGATPWMNASNWVVPVIGMYGVTGLTLEGLFVHDAPAFGYHLANCQDFSIANCNKTIVGFRTGDLKANNDILHFNGHCHRGSVYGLKGETNDDAVGICANDGNDSPAAGIGTVSTYEPGTVAAGPISEIYLSGITVQGAGASELVRFLSADPVNAPIYDITIDGLSGDTNGAGIRFDNFNLVGLGNGHCWNISINNYNPGTAADNSIPFSAVVMTDCLVDRLAISNLVSRQNFVSSPLISMTSGATVGHLKVDGLELLDSAGNATGDFPLIEIDAGATVDFLEASSLRCYRASSTTPTVLPVGAIGVTGGNVNRIQLSNSQLDHIQNAIAVSGGSVNCIQTNALSHTNSGGAASVAQTGTGTISRLRSSCSDTALLHSGTIGSVKTDGTEDA